MTDWAISTDNLTRDFETVRAVDRLSFQVPAGIIFGFLGPNGAGKTTTIRLLLGLLEPTSGRAAVLGFDACSQSDMIRQQSGVLLEHSGLYERLSAEDNLDFYGRIWHLPTGVRKGRIKELLTHLGLWERRKETVKTWSRGMKQKLAVARALLHQPPLVFLDEPTAGLDPVAAKSLQDDLLALSMQEGVTIFLTTHNLTEAQQLCDQVGVIRDGKLLAVGPPDDLWNENGAYRIKVVGRGFSKNLMELLRKQPDVIRADVENGKLLVDLPEQMSIAPLVNLIVNSGARVEEIVKGKSDLHDIFLTLVEEEK